MQTFACLSLSTLLDRALFLTTSSGVTRTKLSGVGEAAESVELRRNDLLVGLLEVVGVDSFEARVFLAEESSLRLSELAPFWPSIYRHSPLLQPQFFRHC